MIDRRSAVCTCTHLRTRECEHNTSSPICPVAAQTRTRSATGLQTVRTTTTAAVHYRWSRPVKAGHGCTAGGGRRAARDVTTVTIVVTSTNVGRTTQKQQQQKQNTTVPSAFGIRYRNIAIRVAYSYTYNKLCMCEEMSLLLIMGIVRHVRYITGLS